MEKSRSAKIRSAQRKRKQVAFRKEGQEPQLSKGKKKINNQLCHTGSVL